VTDDASTGARNDAPSDYDALAETLDAAIEEARQKVESGRVYDAENEKVRIKWIRALAYAVNVRRQVTNDRDLAELDRRVGALEEAAEDGDVNLTDVLDDTEETTVDFTEVDT
jgi:hypothetical protein